MLLARAVRVGLALGVACATPDPLAPATSADDASTATDSDPPRPDSDPPLDTDSPRPEDTDPPRPAWGRGFVEVAGALQTDFPPMFAGDPLVFEAPELSSVVVGDLDEDGRVDVIASSRKSDGRKPGTMRLYHFDGTGQSLEEDVGAAPLFDALPWPKMVVGLMDLDGDGHLDAVLSDASRLVQWGRGDGGFEPDVAQPYLCDGAVNGASLWDVDSDGWSDWVIGEGTCFGRVHVLRRAGPRRWVDEPGWQTGQGDGVQATTILSLGVGDEQLHLVVGSRRVGADEAGWLVGPTHGAGAPYLRAEVRTPAQVFWTQRPEWAGGTILDLAAMGAAAEDLDGDGASDIVITLGGPPLAVLGGGSGGFVDRSEDADLSFGADPLVDVPLPWSLALVDFDRDGRIDIFSTFGDDMTSFTLAKGQANRNMLWWSAGPWDYVELGSDAGLTDRGGWMALSVFDLDADGDADLGVGGNGDAPILLRNQIDNGHHGLSLRLIGTSSNREALGATVEVASASLPSQHRTVTMLANPYSVGEPLQFFGLGTATEATTVRVRWPSGWTQVVHGLAADTLHTLVEPAPFVIEDADRSAPADGASRVGITVRPRLEDGSVDASAQVLVTLEGDGTLSSAAPAWSGDAFRLHVTAPSAPGSARITITVNGVPYDVRPRLAWE